MALSKAFTLPSGVSVPSAYFLIDQVAYAKLQNTLSFLLIGWKDQATRAAYGVAMASYIAAVEAVPAAQAAYEAAEATAAKNFQPGDNDPAAIAALRAPVDAALAALHQANIAQATTQMAAAAIKPLECATFPIQLPIGLVASMLTDGAPDISKLYDYAKTLPDWSSATDV